MARTARAEHRPPRRVRSLAGIVPLLMLGASCVPTGSAEAPRFASAAITAPILDVAADAPLPPDVLPADVQALIGEGALAANAALPLSTEANPAASPFVVRGRTPIDRMRSFECMAQAVYYEAGSESEDGQRAVAQVVLNRVRHPSWPNSVCGVVYQGPMRPGGGCQFTFTCDGSLARRPGGPEWVRARRIAAEALAGRTFAPVGLSTHYHNHSVFPAWAPRLAKTGVIGGHIFYRLPGQWGQPAAFADSYAGHEPFPRPAMTMAPRTAAVALAPPTLVDSSGPVRRSRLPEGVPSEVGRALPPPQIREEYRNSGTWRADSPVAPPDRFR